MFTTPVIECARCGSNHTDIDFWELKNPPADVTHYGICPDTMEPILMLVRDKAEAATSTTPEAVAVRYFAYAVNLGLALSRSVKVNDQEGIVLYTQKLLALVHLPDIALRPTK